jgi:hypothetical protein
MSLGWRQLESTLKNPFHGLFQDGAGKAWFSRAFIFKRLRARKWRHVRMPHGHLEFFKVP